MIMQTKTLSQLTKEVKRGLSSYHYDDGGIKIYFINIGALQNGEVATTSVEQVTVKQTDAVGRSRIEKGDVLVGVKGSFKAAVANENTNGFTISSNIIALKLNGLMLPEILVAYLNGPAGQKELQSRAAGAVQKSLNLKTLLDIPVPVPPLEKQKHLAEFLSLLRQYRALLKKEDQLRENIAYFMFQKHILEGN